MRDETVLGVSYHDLPGAEIVRKGLSDLAGGDESHEAMGLALARPRLVALGVDVPVGSWSQPDLALFESLTQQKARSAHSAFNALRTRVVKFQRALERRVVRDRGASHVTPDGPPERVLEPSRPTGALDAAALRRFFSALSEGRDEPVRLYLLGGASAVMKGFAQATFDLDVVVEPAVSEVDDAFLTRVVELRDALGVPVQYVQPGRALPQLPGWRLRSESMASFGALDVLHYDLVSQIVARVERDHHHDWALAQAMLEGLAPARVWELASKAAPGTRFPHLDEAAYFAKLSHALGHKGDVRPRPEEAGPTRTRRA